MHDSTIILSRIADWFNNNILLIERESLFLLLILLATIIVIYPYLFPSYPDINEFFLKEQSSIANLRFPGETAVYRSKIAPHGRSLISGLSIAGNSPGSGGSVGGTRDGDIGDIWRLALKIKSPLSSVVPDGSGNHALSKFIRIPLSSEELIRLIHGIGQTFSLWVPLQQNGLMKKTAAVEEAAVNTDRNVVIVLGNSLEMIICFFAATLYGFSVVFVNAVDDDEDGLTQLIDIGEPDILICSGEYLDKINFQELPKLRAIVSVNGKVLVENSRNNSLPGSVKHYLIWPDLVSEFKDNSDAEKQQEKFATTVAETPVKIVYKNLSSSSTPTVSDFESPIKVACFTNKCVVSAIAAQIKSLPTSKQWTTKDVVLTYNSQFNAYNFILQLTALVTGSSLVFVDPTNMVHHPLQLIADIQPTIMITDDSITQSLAHMADELTLIDSIRFYCNRSKLVTSGILPKSSQAVLSELNPLRLIHSGTYPNSNSQFSTLTTDQTNTVRALTAAHFIHALNTPLSLSPIAQTALYDYRTTLDGKWVNFGPPLPCLEIKLHDYGDYKASNRDGRLLIRGHSLPSGTEWVEEPNILVHLGDDGCVKELIV